MVLMKMEFPLCREITTTVRLAAGGVASFAGLSFDASEDLKVCVTESLLLLLHAGCSKTELIFEQNENIRVVMTAEGGRENEEKTVEEEISAALLGALVEELSMERKKGYSRISFEFKGV